MAEYRCLNCGDEFDTAEAMNEHIDRAHPDDYGVEDVVL